jgi:hypothetical protein
MQTNDTTITIGVLRPQHGIQLITMRMSQLRSYPPALKVFPDNRRQDESVFPAEGVTITSKPQGHLVIAYQHMERWVLAGFACEPVDLSAFSEHWKGCTILLFDADQTFLD